MDTPDRDMLIEVHQDIKWLKEAVRLHISEHFKVRILVIGSAIAAGVSLLVTLL